MMIEPFRTKEKFQINTKTITNKIADDFTLNLDAKSFYAIAYYFLITVINCNLFIALSDDCSKDRIFMKGELFISIVTCGLKCV